MIRVKGTTKRFYVGGPRNRLQLRNAFTLSVLKFFECSTRNSNVAIGPIQDTIKSTIAVTGIKEFKIIKETKGIYTELETVPWTGSCKIGF